MNRRTFFGRLAAGVAALVAAPGLLGREPEPEIADPVKTPPAKKVLFPEAHKKGRSHTVIKAYPTGEFCMMLSGDVRPDDVLLLPDGNMILVTEVEHLKEVHYERPPGMDEKEWVYYLKQGVSQISTARKIGVREDRIAYTLVKAYGIASSTQLCVTKGDVLFYSYTALADKRHGVRPKE